MNDDQTAGILRALDLLERALELPPGPDGTRKVESVLIEQIRWLLDPELKPKSEAESSRDAPERMAIEKDPNVEGQWNIRTSGRSASNREFTRNLRKIVADINERYGVNVVLSVPDAELVEDDVASG